METLSDLNTQRPYAVRQVNKAFLFFLRLVLKTVHLLRKMFLQMSVVCCSQPKQSSSFLLFSSIYQSLCKTDHTQKEAKWEDSTLTFFLFHLLFLQCIISNTFLTACSSFQLLLRLFLCPEICSHRCHFFLLPKVMSSIWF